MLDLDPISIKYQRSSSRSKLMKKNRTCKLTQINRPQMELMSMQMIAKKQPFKFNGLSIWRMLVRLEPMGKDPKDRLGLTPRTRKQGVSHMQKLYMPNPLIFMAVKINIFTWVHPMIFLCIWTFWMFFYKFLKTDEEIRYEIKSVHVYH